MGRQSLPLWKLARIPAVDGKAPRRARTEKARARRSFRPEIEMLERRDLMTVTATPIAASVPNGDSAGTMLLLPNGTAMVQGGGETSAWYSLTPDSTGNYVNGSWVRLAP